MRARHTKGQEVMSGMYEIVGFDELVGGSFPPHSTQGYRCPYHPHLAAGDLIAGSLESGEDEAAGDGMLTGLDAHSLIAGADPVEQLLAIAGLGGLPGLSVPPTPYPMASYGMPYPSVASAGHWPGAPAPGLSPQMMAIAGLAPAI